MDITLDIPTDEMALLNQEGASYTPPIEGYTLALNQLTPVAAEVICNLRDKYAGQDRALVIAHLNTPQNIATAKAALGL